MAEIIKSVKVEVGPAVCKFPHLNTPDTKFKAGGEYKVTLILNADKAQPLIDQIDALLQQKFDTDKADFLASKEPKVKAKAKSMKMCADKPYKPVLDDEGEETGEFQFTFKMSAQRTDKNSGAVSQQTPKMFDAKGKPLAGKNVQVWGGSVIKVGGFLSPFHTQIGVGVSLKLSAVQIIKLVTGGGSTWAFGEEESEDGESFDGDSFSAGETQRGASTPTTGGDEDDTL